MSPQRRRRLSILLATAIITPALIVTGILILNKPGIPPHLK